MSVRYITMYLAETQPPRMTKFASNSRGHCDADTLPDGGAR